MLRLLILLLIPLLIWSRPAPADPARLAFDQGLLLSEEKAFLQAALTLQGEYNGLIDGAWGRGSAAALSRWSSRKGYGPHPSFGQIKPLVAGFQTELSIGGWAPVNLPDASMSFQVPMALLSLDKSSGHPTLHTPARSLLVRNFFEGSRQTADMHEWQLANHSGPRGSLYSSYKQGRLITSARLRSGKTAYLRSDRSGAGFHSILVQYEPWEKARGQLIAASVSRRMQSEFRLPAGGILAALMGGGLAQPAPPQPPALAAVPPGGQNPGHNSGQYPGQPPAGGNANPKGTGTGFYVNNTDIVTAAHVIDGCTAMRLENGAALTLIRADRGLDLAVLSTARRSASWLPLSDQVTPKLGEKVMAVGYPLPQLFEQGLTATGGNISALPNAMDPAKKVMLTSPIQPGNSGGPVLNLSGQVVGVVVARANDLRVLEGTGALPQNMNFAVSVQPLLDFLDKAQVLFPRGAARAASLEDGIPAATQGSIVQVLCY